MPVVGTYEATSAIGMAPPRPGKLGQAVGEVAEGGAACHRDQAERGYGKPVPASKPFSSRTSATTAAAGRAARAIRSTTGSVSSREGVDQKGEGPRPKTKLQERPAVACPA